MPKTYIKDPFFSRNLSFTPDLLKIITDFKRGVPKNNKFNVFSVSTVKKL